MPSDFSARRRRIYQAQLDATEKCFAELLDQDPFTALDKRMEPAVKDPGLVEALAEILDVYVLYGMRRDFQRLTETRALMVRDASRPPPLNQALPPTSGPRPAPIADRRKDLSSDDVIGRYLDWYIEPDDVGNGVSGADAFLARYPLLVYAIDKVTSHHQENVKTACRRISTDWTKIEAAFFPDDSLVALSSITTTGNDFHKGGKQVLILGFEMAKSPKPGLVVYKPSSVEIDCRIVGNTEIVNTYKPQGYTQTASLSELINKYNPPRPRPEGFTSSELPTYTILPYNRGSVTDGYGYIEYLTRLPRVEGPFTAHTDMLDTPARKVATLSPDEVEKSDWVISGPVAGQVFYHQLGVLMAMAQAVSLCDLHVQNMIVHAKSPHLIDLEEALKHPMTKIDETYLTQLVDKLGDPESPVVEVHDDQNTPYPIIGWFSPIGRPAASTLFRSHGQGSPGEPVVLAGDAKSDGERNRRALVRGVIDCVDALATDPCNADVKNWATGLSGVLARFVAVATATYAQAGRSFYMGCCESSVDTLTKADGTPDDAGYSQLTTDPVDGEKNFFFDVQVRTRRGEWINRDADRSADPALLRAWRAPPFFALEHSAHVWRDYLNCDVPSFYHRLDSTDLFNSAGVPVAVDDAIRTQTKYFPGESLPAWSANPGAGYLPQTPIDMVRTQLDDLKTACATPGGKRRYLNEALDTMPGGESLYRGVAAGMLTLGQLKTLAEKKGTRV